MKGKKVIQSQENMRCTKDTVEKRISLDKGEKKIELKR